MSPMPRGMHPTVNETYTMTPLYRVPQEVRLGLPPIPAELDYRIAAPSTSCCGTSTLESLSTSCPMH